MSSKKTFNEVSTKNIVNASVISFICLICISIGSAIYLDYSNPGSYAFSEGVQKQIEMLPEKELIRLKTDIINLCISLYHFNHSMPTSPSDKKAEYRYDLFKKLLDSELILFRLDLQHRFEAFSQLYPIQSIYILPYINSLIVPISTFVFTILLFYIFYEIQTWLSNPKSEITSYHKFVIAIALILNLIVLLSGPLVLIPNVDGKMNLADINVDKCSTTLYDADRGAFESRFDMADIIDTLT
uniref:Uncharacterized protein n=1 Tax=Panagrolaimus sp. ES5 TaxID=591445 RepID=A0AC34F334_9BILA